MGNTTIVRFKTSGTNTPLVKKAYIKEDGRWVIKRRVDGASADEVIDVDLKGLNSGRYTPTDPSTENIVEAVIEREPPFERVHLELDARVNGTAPDDIVDVNYEGPYPKHFYTASGETETEEASIGSIPSFLTDSQKTKWFARLGAAYRQAMKDNEYWWWKLLHAAGSTEYWRVVDIGEVEIPNWLKAADACVAAAIAGRAWTAMTNTQIEACVAHFEALVKAKIVETWYRVGKGQTTSSSYPVPNSGMPARNGTAYASSTTFGTTILYTDMFQVSSNILVPRTPDYAWLPIVVNSPANFDPENPS